jgi:murein L,D-transpeptidase YcbB/YkuD
MKQLLVCTVGVLISVASGISRAQLDETQERVRDRVEEISSGELQIGDATVAAIHLIPELYQRRNFRLAWTKPKNVEELLRLLRDAEAEGLNPRDYHIEELVRLRDELHTGVASPGTQVDLDILLTDAFVRWGYHVYFGKVNPESLDSDWNLARTFGGQDPVAIIQEAIDAESLEQYAATFVSRKGPLHERLKAVLAQYREIQQQAGWPPLEAGPTLRKGMTDARVPVLRERLRGEGYFSGPDPVSPNGFDEVLEQAVKVFQDRHRLVVDGAVGPKTRRALNVPVEARVDQIRVNLERGRWVFRDVEDYFVVVNIAGFRVYVVRDGEFVWTGRAQVGKPYRKTPVFKSEMKYLVFNPTWTVPPTILSKDVLPAIRRDPGYLSSKNMKVLDRKRQVVDPSEIDWRSATGKRFPYQIRQDPGPTNALGRVKFIFPNPHFVFLHDTPSKSLFERRERTFSSGCIRVDDPFDLAEFLLADESKWNRDHIQKVLDSKRTRTVFLPKPVPTFLLYWTVSVEEEGRVRFLRDVYGRDQRVLAALNAEFSFDLPSDLRKSLGY